MDAISPAAARPRSSHAPVAPFSARRALLGTALLTLALLVLLAAAGAERASACVSPGFAPLPLSSFEGADGDQCDSDATGPRRDWQTVAGDANLHSTIDASSDNDTSYGSNNAGIVDGSTSENVPDSWNFTTGNMGGGKYDALAATSFTDPENGKLFLDLGFVRETTSGATFLAFELNQRQPGYRQDANEADPARPFSVPTRTRGDLLVTYDISNAGAQTLGLCIWDGNEHAGQWEEFSPDLTGVPITNQACPALSGALYQAALNDGAGGHQGAIPGSENYLSPGTAILQGQFGEAVVNLTDALRDPENPTGPQPCVDFGYVWLHSRSSDSLTSNQKDLILPTEAISIGSCTVEGAKFNDLDGDGARSVGEPYLGGWTMFVDYDNDGTLDNDLDTTFVNDLDGIVEAGEEEPYDVTADGTGTEPLGSYRITKVQPSNHASNPAGTWPVREVLPATWDCTAAVGAGAVVAPNVCPEDTSTNPGSALGFRLAWNDNQTYSNRNFGNRRRPAQLKVVKHVINDDGGTATAGAWSLHVKSGATEAAGSPQAGDEAGDTYSLTDGQSYSVSETGGPAGYAATFSGDCDANGAVTVAAGTLKTCTITNNDVAPVLKVVKHVINDNGGTKAAADFSLTVDDPGDNPAAIAGAEAPGTNVVVDPGAYSVSEGAHAGYAVSYSAGCSGSLAVGQTATCTVTNDDVAPVLKVVKHVVNDNGGTKAAADFSLTVDDPGDNPAPFDGAEAPGTDVVVDPGGYSVSEGPHAGYAVSYSADCAGTLAIGETKTCTVTNDDIAPKLTVIKHVVNDDGGTKSAGDFSLTVDDPGDDPASFTGSEAGTSVTVDPGAYSVSEGAHAGYAVSYSADCTGTLAIGETRTCTVTNDDIAPVLTVVKHVVNDDGGTESAADFSLAVADTGKNPAPIAGAEAPGTEVAIDAGAYSVSEGAHDGYAVTYSPECSGTLAIGETRTCTVTNDDIAPKLTVIKHVVNDGGGTKPASDFSLTVDDPGDNPGSIAGSETGTIVTVDPGAYSVSEGAHDGYAVSYSPGCAGTLAIGETKTCTVTNDDIAPVLKVVKHMINGHGGTKSAADFSITVDDPGNNPAPFAAAEAPGTNVTVDPGEYSVAEGAHDGYAVSYSADCTGTLAIGETKTCTVTNNDIAPTLTVIKEVVNKAGSSGRPSDFTMHVTGNPITPGGFAGAGAPGVTKTLAAGPYDVSETGAATDDYTQSKSAGCSGTLAIGDERTCTITNTRKTGTITVRKDLVPADDGGLFDLTVDGDVVREDASDGDGATIEVATGTHTVGERAGGAGALGDYVSSIACGDGDPVSGRGPLEVAVGDGDELTCTITNTRRATITVRTVTQPDDPGKAASFGFTSSLPETPGPVGILLGGLFALADGDSVTTTVAPGERSVTEDNPAPRGYRLVGLTCTEDKAQNSTVSTGTALAIDRLAAIVADPGETIVCTFTNRKVVGQAVVVKAGDTFAYHGESASYTFAVSNTGNSSLHDIAVTDDKCANVSSAPTSRQNDNGDELLDPVGADESNPEVWIYTCTYTLGSHQDGEANPVVNTATVTAVDELDRPVGDTDQHSTRLLHPAIALTKTGPATATAGSRVVYAIAAKNTGDVAFAAALVVVTDARCEAPPLLLGTGGDASPGTLDPGDTWQYACAVQSAVGESAIHNVALVDGTDVNGRHAKAEAAADTLLVAPPAPRQAVAANVGSGDPVLAPASAKLRGPTGCMPRTAKVAVTGRRIASVTFTLDGRAKRTVRRADKAGRYTYSVSKAKVRTGTHRVRARVVYLPGSSARARTLVMSLNKCRPAVVKPAFTG